MKTPGKIIAAGLLATVASPSFALNILLSNDDGLTSNLKALYEALTAAGHDVLVSVPCTGQSGRGAGIVMYSTDVIVADNDSQITDEGGCHNGAAATGAPAVGEFTKSGFTGGAYNYVHGTPVMATMYGLDVLVPARWGKAPDVVLSGPNEGQNVGSVVNSSGTVSNAQFAASRGIPAIALSAGTDTVDNDNLSNANSKVVAQLSVQLLNLLVEKADGGALLPEGLALNVNFPDSPSASTPFAFSRHGTYNIYTLKFNNAVPYGLGINMASSAPNDAQLEDESVVYQSKTAVTAMQVGFDSRPAAQQWLRLRLDDN